MNKKLFFTTLAVIVFSLLSVFLTPSVFAEPYRTPVNEAIGAIEPPQSNEAIAGQEKFKGQPIPIFAFITWGLTIFTVIAGIWILFNVVFAAFEYFGGNGDPGSHQKVRQRITNSLIGFILIIMAYSITALVATMLFGDPTYFFNPTLRRM